MKTVSLLCALLAGGIFFGAVAQVPPNTQLSGHPSWPSYRDTREGQKLDFVFTGSSFSNLDSQNVLVNQFEMQSFRNGDSKQIQIIAQAPRCMVDVANSVASDKGPLQIFTPTTNLFVQGVGFLFTKTNHLLIISNQVETRVLKSLLRSSLLAAPRTNAVADTNRLFISAAHGRFDLISNVVDYAGNVHMIDPQLDMTCDLMTIRLASNGTVESILARQNVVLTTTNNGRATGATGLYYVTNNNVQMMQLSTDATWRNGDEEARANEFIYDSTRHFLTGIGHVRVRWPNAKPKPSGPAANSTALLADTNGFRLLFADFATLQFPPTNGPVQNMHARGNVIIVNQADLSSSMSERADYEKATDSFELTGHPVWWNRDAMGNDQMEVKADTLLAELGGKTYHARANARFKMRTGGGATNHPAVASGHSTNQWVFISSDDMDYQTNLAVFSRNVETRLVESNRLKDTLNCDLLTLHLTNNQVESAFASGRVHGETAPNAFGVIKTIACAQLNAYLAVATGLIKSIDAHTNVVIEEKGTSRAAPRNQLMAETATAYFSAVTNQIERAIAEQNVVLDQLKDGHNIHATASRAVYTGGAIDQVKLTGAPLARKDNYMITDSDFLIWRPNANAFQASGRYSIVPIKPAAGQKSL
jgi:lipopolysaccharide export system protein LptA